MSSQVLETWINETLTDADHLDIPGVILKPEHKLPIERYGISKRELTTAGIPPDTALALSVSYGFVFMASGLPGLVVWLSMRGQSSETPNSDGS